jgi:hypothetical protein
LTKKLRTSLEKNEKYFNINTYGKLFWKEGQEERKIRIQDKDIMENGSRKSFVTQLCFP